MTFRAKDIVQHNTTPNTYYALVAVVGSVGYGHRVIRNGLNWAYTDNTPAVRLPLSEYQLAETTAASRRP